MPFNKSHLFCIIQEDVPVIQPTAFTDVDEVAKITETPDSVRQYHSTAPQMWPQPLL